MTVAVRVIPCLDVDAGRVVKGVNFVDLRDAGDPVELGAAYDAAGADELVFLDVTASSDQRQTMLDVVRRTAETVFIPLTVGGGVRSVADVDTLLRAGADKVGVNTAAIARPELIAEIADRFGNQVLTLSLDVRRAPGLDSGFEVTTHGGRRGTGHGRGRVGRAGASSSARARSCSTRWTTTAPSSASTCALIARGPGGGRRAGHRLGRGGQGGRLPTGGRGRRRRGARRERVPLRRDQHRRRSRTRCARPGCPSADAQVRRRSRSVR